MSPVAKSLRSFVPVRVTRLASGVALVAAVAAPLAGCTSAQLQGESSSYLIIRNLRGASGAEPDKLAGTLSSDVQTLVKQQIAGQEVLVPTIYEDPGVVTFRLGMKDPGANTTPTIPSSTNFITVNRYRVNYVRADGRNTPGVDVPYGFDSAFTATVTATDTEASLALVRIQAKLENPLIALSSSAKAISTIAEVTFYGTDQSGREVTVMGRIGITFADWGDPE